MCIRDSTELVDDAKMQKKMLEEQPNYAEIYTEPTYDELKDHLQNFLNPSAAEEKKEEAEPVKEMVSTTEASNTKVEDDFDKLFNS